MCFVQVSKQKGIMSLYSFNRLVLITDKDSVNCLVRAEYLNATQSNIVQKQSKIRNIPL